MLMKTMETKVESRPETANQNSAHTIPSDDNWNDMGLHHGCSPTKPLLTYTRLVLIVTCLKLLLLPAYRSTDFEVHRNWLAITHSLPVNQWYRSNVSEWTLDYPPLFAYVESSLSKVASVFDPLMLKVDNLNYASPKTVLFQRMSVIALDSAYVYAVYDTTKYLSTRYPAGLFRSLASPPVLFACLSLANAGLLLVDHIHFQYNGFLIGAITLAVTRLLEKKWLKSAFYFSVAINLKHIFLYMAPAFGVFMLRQYCFDDVRAAKTGASKVAAAPTPSQSEATTQQEPKRTDAATSTDSFLPPLSSFNLPNFLKLASIPILVTSVCFAPFVTDLPKVLGRLFPFKRGLTHAYWAPNFWALYNAADKFLSVGIPIARKYAGLTTTKQPHSFANATVADDTAPAAASFTGGLVQQYEHSVLPSVSPGACLVLTLVAMLPSLLYLWRLRGPISGVGFARGMVGVSFASFLFGWHVHEKAILYVMLPSFVLLAVMHYKDAHLFLVLQLTAHYSLFPLLFEERERPIEYLVTLLYAMYCFNQLAARYCAKSLLSWWPLPMLSRIESIYVYGFVLLEMFNSSVFPLTPQLRDRLPFLPLMLISVYCALGMFYVWIRLNVDMYSNASRSKLS